MHATDTNGFDIVIQEGTSSQQQRRSAAGPGLKAWLHATWAAWGLTLVSEKKVDKELQQLRQKAQELRQQGRDDDADALEQRELHKLAEVPFAMRQLLPQLLEAGQYDLAVATALRAYEHEVKVNGRSHESAVLAGVSLGIALAAAYRHNEARPLLHDGVVVAMQRIMELGAIKSSVVELSKRGRWGMKLSHILWEKYGPVSTFYNSIGSEAGFYHVLSQLLESRWEVERNWKSVGCKSEVKAKLDNMTKMMSGLANDVGSDSLRVKNALREYERVLAMPQLKRQRQVRQALKSHAKELQAAVKTTRQHEQTEEQLKFKVALAAATQQEQVVQETLAQLVALKLRKQGVDI